MFRHAKSHSWLWPWSFICSIAGFANDYRRRGLRSSFAILAALKKFLIDIDTDIDERTTDGRSVARVFKP